MRKEDQRRKTIEQTAYLLVDEDSDLWMEFSILKATYTESLRARLEAARKTLRELEGLGEQSGLSWSLQTMGAIRHSARQRRKQVRRRQLAGPSIDLSRSASV